MIWVVWIFAVCISTSHGRFTINDYASVPPIFHLDNYERCLNSDDENGLFCFVGIKLEPLDPKKISDTFKTIQKLSDDPTHLRYDAVRHGICVSNTFSEINSPINSNRNHTHLLKMSISKLYNEKYYGRLGLKGSVVNITCETKEPLHKIDAWDISIGTCSAFFIAFVLCASAYVEIVTTQKTALSKVEQYLLCFSIPRNWRTLKAGDKSYQTDKLSFFNGLRCIAIMNQVSVHVGTMLIMVPSLNPQYISNSMHDSFGSLFLNSYVIQHFFIMSAWLVSYTSFKALDKSTPTNCVAFVLRKFRSRLFRLVPSVAVVSALVGTWLYHLPRGANWERMVGVEYRNCRRYWWRNVFLLNNFYESSDVCLMHFWSVAADSHLYFFSLILITLAWKYKWAGRIFGSSLVVAVVILGVVNYWYAYGVFIFAPLELIYNVKGLIAEHALYISTYSNFGCYFIGLMYGYMFYRWEKRGCPETTCHKNVVWTSIFLIPIGLSLYQSHLECELKPFSRFGNAVFFTVARHTYAFSVAEIMYGLCQGHCELLRKFLTWTPFQVFGKLVYSAVIIHMVLLRVWAGQFGAPVHFTLFFLVMAVWGCMVVSFALATILYLFVEQPFCEMHEVMFCLKKADNTPTKRD